MKRRILTGFAVIVLGITMVMGCGGGGGGGSSTSKQDEVKLDKNVNLTVPTSPSEIGSFSASKNYTAASKEQADNIINGIFGSDGPLSGFLASTQLSSNILYSRSTASRAIKTESIRQNFTEKDLADDVDDDFLKYVTIKGYVDATAKYDDAKDDYFALNGVAAARIDIKEGFTDEGYETFGVVAGELRANNVQIKEEKVSGSVVYNINGAINVANTTSKKYVKCIFSAKSTLSLSSEKVTVTISIKAYGDGTTPLASYSETVTQSLSDYM